MGDFILEVLSWVWKQKVRFIKIIWSFAKPILVSLFSYWLIISNPFGYPMNLVNFIEKNKLSDYQTSIKIVQNRIGENNKIFAVYRYKTEFLDRLIVFSQNNKEGKIDVFNNEDSDGILTKFVKKKENWQPTKLFTQKKYDDDDTTPQKDSVPSPTTDKYLIDTNLKNYENCSDLEITNTKYRSNLFCKLRENATSATFFVCINNENAFNCTNLTLESANTYIRKPLIYLSIVNECNYILYYNEDECKTNTKIGKYEDFLQTTKLPYFYFDKFGNLNTFFESTVNFNDEIKDRVIQAFWDENIKAQYVYDDVCSIPKAGCGGAGSGYHDIEKAGYPLCEDTKKCTKLTSEEKSSIAKNKIKDLLQDANSK